MLSPRNIGQGFSGTSRTEYPDLTFSNTPLYQDNLVGRTDAQARERSKPDTTQNISEKTSQTSSAQKFENVPTSKSEWATRETPNDGTDTLPAEGFNWPKEVLEFDSRAEKPESAIASLKKHVVAKHDIGARMQLDEKADQEVDEANDSAKKEIAAHREQRRADLEQLAMLDEALTARSRELGDCKKDIEEFKKHKRADQEKYEELEENYRLCVEDNEGKGSYIEELKKEMAELGRPQSFPSDHLTPSLFENIQHPNSTRAQHQQCNKRIKDLEDLVDTMKEQKTRRDDMFEVQEVDLERRRCGSKERVIRSMCFRCQEVLIAAMRKRTLLSEAGKKASKLAQAAIIQAGEIGSKTLVLRGRFWAGVASLTNGEVNQAAKEFNEVRHIGDYAWIESQNLQGWMHACLKLQQQIDA